MEIQYKIEIENKHENIKKIFQDMKRSENMEVIKSGEKKWEKEVCKGKTEEGKEN